MNIINNKKLKTETSQQKFDHTQRKYDKVNHSIQIKSNNNSLPKLPKYYPTNQNYQFQINTYNKYNKLFPSSINNTNTRIQPSLYTKQFLKHDTIGLITAKKWAIYDIKHESQKTLIKGYKTKSKQYVHNLTKIMVFLCSYLIIRRYCLIPQKFELIYFRISQTELIPKANKNQLITLNDILHELMLTSSIDTFYIVAIGLGCFINKKNKGIKYNPLQIEQSNKNEYLQIFGKIMKITAEQLDLKNSQFVERNPELNQSSPQDLSILTIQCMKIPLFLQIIKTKTYSLKIKLINQSSQSIKQIIIYNNNLLLNNLHYKGVKTAYNPKIGSSLIAIYENSYIKILVIVIGSSGKQAHYSDTQKLVAWYNSSNRNKQF